MSNEEIPATFLGRKGLKARKVKVKSQKYTFRGGPSDGDTLKSTSDTYWVETIDKKDPNLRHSYVRAGNNLVYQNSTRTPLSEQGKAEDAGDE